MAGKKILIIEDEKQIARFIELELRHEGYTIFIEYDGISGLNRARAGKPDLILLDIMLPGLNGLTVCRKIREFSSVPILVLTARDEVSDKVTGLDAGANDYITKPFDLRELLARIRAAFRNNGQKEKSSSVLLLDDLSMNLSTHIVQRAGRTITLTRKEYDLLEYLLKNKGLVLTREQILDSVWGMDYIGDANVVDVYIRYLRSKIDEPFPTRLIRTVRGFGYVLGEQKSDA